MRKEILPLVFVCLLLLGGCGGSESGFKPETEENSNIEVDSEAIIDYYAIIDLVGIDREDAAKVEKIEDWYAGPRYSFPTEGTTARIYCNMDGTINMLKVGVDIDLYKQGFEPWRIENFIVDEDLKDSLIYCAEESVSACLKYPSSADFPLLDWSFGREFNRYTVNSYVEAVNSFGVLSEMPFTAGFWVDDEQIQLIYLMLDGSVVVNETEDFPLPERTNVETDTPDTTPSEIHIIDGQLGDYREVVVLDDYEYIWYKVPAGVYNTTCNSKQCTVYVDKNEITRNSSGYAEMENVATYELEYGEVVEIVVGPDEHIFTSIYADFMLVPVKEAE